MANAAVGAMFLCAKFAAGTDSAGGMFAVCVFIACANPAELVPSNPMDNTMAKDPKRFISLMG